MNKYQEKITELYLKQPKHAIKMIFSNTDLKKWVENNCDPASPNKLTMVYTAYHNILLVCPCGSGKLRKCNRFNNGLAFCGTRSCSINAIIIKEKTKQTNLERYGVVDPMSNFEVQEKGRKTNLERYGTEFTFQNKDVKEKIKNTNVERYGFENVSQNSNIQRKRKLSNLEKYGFNHPSSTIAFRERVKNTNLERYGVDNPQKINEVKEKTKQTNLERYGFAYINQRHYSKLAKEILFDIEKFKSFLEQHGVKNMALLLETSESNIYVKHLNFGLNIISASSSSYESEIATWLLSHNIEFIQNSKKIISPLELDFYLPNQKVAIEFNGLYWHSEIECKNKNYHFDKMQRCNKLGIRLIHIFEDEWRNKREVCLDVLSRILNIKMIHVAARKCQIKELTNKDSREFLENNHLQGYASATINLGMFYENNLIQLLTFRKPRYNKNIQWENVRCCNKIGYQIIGGVGKLWTYFLRKYNPESVVSYCDLRWFTGETYKKLLFHLNHITKIQYYYTNYKNRWHRSLFTKKKCIKKAISLNNITENLLNQMTENQITKEILHLDRIWDCGQQTWIWKQ